MTRFAFAGTVAAFLAAVGCSKSMPPKPHREGVPAEPARGAPPTEPSAATQPGAAEEPPAEPVASASAPAATEPACAPLDKVAGWDECEAVEVTGAPPCEAICRRARRLATTNRCCQDPVEVAVLSGARALLRLNACRFVPPDCANVHGHGNMDARLRLLAGSPPELVFVEGGCESRAMMHGYVPPGVAAWSGCNHQRYRWDGTSLVKVAQKP